jgi:hypothetical protein
MSINKQAGDLSSQRMFLNACQYPLTWFKGATSINQTKLVSLVSSGKNFTLSFNLCVWQKKLQFGAAAALKPGFQFLL